MLIEPLSHVGFRRFPQGPQTRRRYSRRQHRNHGLVAGPSGGSLRTESRVRPLSPVVVPLPGSSRRTRWSRLDQDGCSTGFPPGRLPPRGGTLARGYGSCLLSLRYTLLRSSHRYRCAARWRHVRKASSRGNLASVADPSTLSSPHRFRGGLAAKLPRPVGWIRADFAGVFHDPVGSPRPAVGVQKRSPRSLGPAPPGVPRRLIPQSLFGRLRHLPAGWVECASPDVPPPVRRRWSFYLARGRFHQPEPTFPRSLGVHPERGDCLDLAASAATRPVSSKWSYFLSSPSLRPEVTVTPY
jgi:hypothetical protein